MRVVHGARGFCNINIEAIMIEYLRKAYGIGKVAIVDDADDFNEESANCFLKTLEEPQPGSLFLFIGPNGNRQCQPIF